MKEKIMKEIQLLKDNYNNGNYTSHEYFSLLGELNIIVWGMVKFSLVKGINPSEIQEIIHREQEEVMEVVE